MLLKELLLSLGHHVLVLDTHDLSSPFLDDSSVSVVETSAGITQVLKVSQVFFLYFSNGKGSSGLLVDKLSKSCLTLDEAVWNTHFLAKSWQEDNELNWVDVMSNDDELSLSLLNQGGDVVETELEADWFSRLGFLSVSLVLGLLLESLNLLLLVLRSVLGKKFEKFMSVISFESVRKLINLRRNRKSLQQDPLLSLESYVLWPFDKSSQVPLYLDLSSNSKIFLVLGEQVFWETRV